MKARQIETYHTEHEAKFHLSEMGYEVNERGTWYDRNGLIEADIIPDRETGEFQIVYFA